MPAIAGISHRLTAGALLIADDAVVASYWHAVVSRLLRRESSVLELECGCGTLARNLIYHPYIKKYIGFDLVKSSIDWCVDTIKPRIGNRFEFHHIDRFSSESSADGGVQRTGVVIPAATGTINLAFSCSSFTHFLKDDARRYLEEVRRVLAREGLFLSSIDIEPSPAADYSDGESRVGVSGDDFVQLARTRVSASRRDWAASAGKRFFCSWRGTSLRGERTQEASSRAVYGPVILCRRPSECRSRRPAASLARLSRPREACQKLLIHGSELMIKGWARGMDGEPIDGFKVTLAGKELERYEVLNRLPSPDVVAASPAVLTKGHCGFRIRALLNEDELGSGANIVHRCYSPGRGKGGLEPDGTDGINDSHAEPRGHRVDR